MSLKKSLPVLLALPFALGGCAALGLGPNTAPAPSASPSAAPGPPGGPGWLVLANGSATPSPSASNAGTRVPALPPVSFLPVAPVCESASRIDQVLIPLTVTPAKGSLILTWARQFSSNYRITAVPQPLVVGNQPAHPWQNVGPAAGCTVTATIRGLTPGKPYVVWLDAPNSGHERDGTRHPYSGRSGVVYPL
jgi:hypothetical protein